jgi:hypothetical protein
MGKGISKKDNLEKRVRCYEKPALSHAIALMLKLGFRPELPQARIYPGLFLGFLAGYL